MVGETAKEKFDDQCFYGLSTMDDEDGSIHLAGKEEGK